MLLLDADILAVITLHEVLTAVIGAGERGALFSRTALAIGKQVFMEVRAKQREDEKKAWIERQKIDDARDGLEKVKPCGCLLLLAVAARRLTVACRCCR